MWHECGATSVCAHRCAGMNSGMSKRKTNRTGAQRTDWPAILNIAAVVLVDPRTVVSFLEGTRINRAMALAIEKAAKELGLEHMLPKQPEAPRT